MISRFGRWYDARLVTGDVLLAALLLLAFALPSELAEAADVAVGSLTPPSSPAASDARCSQQRDLAA